MTGNIIVIVAVCAAIFYLYRCWQKTKNSDSPSCAGCGGCCTGEKDTRNTTCNSIGDNETKEN